MQDAARAFWEEQTSSRHRYDSPDFYERKAREHASVIHAEDAALPAIDLGCGAGELLEHLKSRVRIVAGLDYSQAMLEQARRRNPELHLICADFKEYVANCREPVWLATGSVNQYIDAPGQRDVLDHFRRNPASKTLYLFDNVDPIRYFMTSRARLLDYVGDAPVSRLGLLLAFGRIGIRGLLRPASLDVVHLGMRMGYGYRPAFWLREARARELVIEVQSSRYYEYRYHLVIQKP